MYYNVKENAKNYKKTIWLSPKKLKKYIFLKISFVIPAKAGIYFLSFTPGLPLQFTLTKVGVGMTESILGTMHRAPT